MKSRWYLIFTVLLFSQTSLVFAQKKTSTPTGVVKNTSDEYNRQLEKCKVDAQVAPTPTSSTSKATNNAGSQKAKSE